LTNQPSPNLPNQVTWKWSEGSNANLAVDIDESDGYWKADFNATTTEFELLQQTFPADVIFKIVEELNRYADQKIAHTPQFHLTRRQKKWKPVNCDEILIFIAARTLMGIDQKPQYSDYWSSDPLIKSSMVPKILSSDRFFEIQKYLHFNNNSQQEPGDRLFKIRDVWTMFT